MHRTVLAAQVDRSLQPELRDQDLQCILADKQHVAVLLLRDAAEEEMRVQVDRCSTRVLGHSVAIVQVVAQMRRFLFVQKLRVRRVGTNASGQQPMNDDIGISDRTQTKKFDEN